MPSETLHYHLNVVHLYVYLGVFIVAFDFVELPCISFHFIPFGDLEFAVSGELFYFND